MNKIGNIMFATHDGSANYNVSFATHDVLIVLINTFKAKNRLDLVEKLLNDPIFDTLLEQQTIQSTDIWAFIIACQVSSDLQDLIVSNMFGLTDIGLTNNATHTFTIEEIVMELIND